MLGGAMDFTFIGIGFT